MKFKTYVATYKMYCIVTYPGDSVICCLNKWTLVTKVPSAAVAGHFGFVLEENLHENSQDYCDTIVLKAPF